TFVTRVAGWGHCLGRRTVTAVALAAGVAGSRHISVFHRFSRARWTLDEVGHVLVGWPCPGAPLPSPPPSSSTPRSAAMAASASAWPPCTTTRCSGLPANPSALAARCRRWRSVSVTIYGRAITTQVVTGRALWHIALRDHPLRIVVVSDPSGR